MTSPLVAAWPVFRSLQGYKPRAFSADLIAGLTLAAIAIPEQMATARLGGLGPDSGFTVFIAGSLGFAVFGANRFLSSGADSTITPIFTGGLVALAALHTPRYGQMAAMLALIVGMILVAGGWFRMGWIADLLSVPVTTGFMGGIAAHIVVSQLPSLLGMTAPAGSLFQNIIAIVSNLNGANLYAATIGLSVLILMVGAERISAKIPAALVALVAATVSVNLFDLQHHGVAVLGPVAGGLPVFTLPGASADELIHLLPLAIMIGLIIMVQTAATSRSFPAGPDEPVDVNRDFLGVGAGSILAGFFGGFPVNASPPRTGIVSATGGQSQLAGLTAASIILGLAVFGQTLLAEIPNAALAGILLFVAHRLVRIEAIVEVYRQTVPEFLLIMVTMAAIIAFPIEIGVTAGIILSLVHGMWTTTKARTIELKRLPGTSIWWPPTAVQSGETMPGVCVVAFQGPLSFLNAYEFKRGILTVIERRSDTVTLVVESSNIAEIDYTAAQIFISVIQYCHSLNITVAIARLESLRAEAAFERFGILSLLSQDHVFHSVDEAVRFFGEKIASP